MVYKIIKEIAATRSRNDKEAILSREVGNTDLKNFFRLALNPFIKFYQKKKFTQRTTNFGDLPLAMTYLELVISARKLTGNDAIDGINIVLDTLSEDDGKVIMLILSKKSGCDLGVATINKIWPKLIPTFPCLLATAYTQKLAEKLNWAKGVYSQLKSDGGRVAIVVDDFGDVSVFSRAGNELNVFGAFDFLGETFKGFVIDGELLTVEPNGKFSPRQKSNGIFTKCVRDTLSEDESKTLHVTSWDIIPLEDFKNEKCKLTYKYRFELLTEKLKDFPVVTISLIPSRIVHSIAQSQEHYQEMISQGEEGTMLKQPNMLWENKRSKSILKLKAEDPNEFEVIGYKDGVGKLTGNLGSLEIASSDRIVVASMSGYSLKLRSEIYANLTGNTVPYRMVINDAWVDFMAFPGESDIAIGSIIECKHNGKIKSRDSSTWSVFLPRFEKVRNDKTVANAFAEIK